jgi:small subunit ribosomal protein S16
VTVKLRLMRMGKKKQPTYRIVAADSASPRDGRFIEIVGTYAPRSEPSVVLVDNAKVLRWLETGAQPTERVRKLLAISGAWGEFESARTARAASRPAKQKPPRKRATGKPPGANTKPSASVAKGATDDKAIKVAAGKPASAAKAAPATKPPRAAKVSGAEVAAGDAGAADESEGES